MKNQIMPKREPVIFALYVIDGSDEIDVSKDGIYFSTIEAVDTKLRVSSIVHILKLTIGDGWKIIKTIKTDDAYYAFALPINVVHC